MTGGEPAGQEPAPMSAFPLAMDVAASTSPPQDAEAPTPTAIEAPEPKPMPEWIVMRVAIRSAHFPSLEEYHRELGISLKQALTRILDRALEKKIKRFQAWKAAGRPHSRTAPMRQDPSAPAETVEWLP